MHDVAEGRRISRRPTLARKALPWEAAGKGRPARSDARVCDRERVAQGEVHGVRDEPRNAMSRTARSVSTRGIVEL